MNKLKYLFQVCFYPVILFGTLILAWSLREGGTIPMATMAALLVIVNGIIWIFEFVLPYEKSWRPDKKVLGLDIFYSLSAALFLTPLMKLGVFKIYTSFDFEFLKIWPNQWPVIIQLLIAIIFADFFIYWFHRWCHLTDFGWKAHVIHHTPSKLHFWASARTHPINLFIFYTVEISVLLFLGVEKDIIALWTMFMSINGQFEHCNIDIKPGILTWVLQTCVSHRAHHSPNWKYSNSNFGNQTLIWDHVFGTYHIPKEEIREVGIKMHNIPESYWEQLKAPFKLDKYKC